jgi:LysM repeat protein
MKTKITVFLILISLFTFAQEDGFEEILLDGKVAYLNNTTGEIKYPKGLKKSTSIKTTTKDSSKTDNENHIIKKGETLYSLSKQYGISLHEIYKSNDLTSSSIISIGQQIKISNIQSANYHIVSKGQSLYSISKKFGLSISELKNLNNLSSNTILIGQKLMVK